MGTARQQEIRIQALGLIALVVLSSVMVISAAVAFGAKWHFQIPGTAVPQDVGGASATYQQR